ncbi:MAG: hypothetical protein KAX88_00955 [Rhodoferax sp.]|nr:hypothetical protein [Rhodoferax sp.]
MRNRIVRRCEWRTTHDARSEDEASRVHRQPSVATTARAMLVDGDLAPVRVAASDVARVL